MGEGGWIKSLLLCFDKVGVLLPEYMVGRETRPTPSSLARSWSQDTWSSSIRRPSSTPS